MNGDRYSKGDKRQIKENLKLTASAGVSYNKFHCENRFRL